MDVKMGREVVDWIGSGKGLLWTQKLTSGFHESDYVSWNQFWEQEQHTNNTSDMLQNERILSRFLFLKYVVIQNSDAVVARMSESVSVVTLAIQMLRRELMFQDGVLSVSTLFMTSFLKVDELVLNL